jgi:predicted nucleic acid-binding protein
MDILVDANVLLRLADPANVAHSTAAAAVTVLRGQGDVLHIAPQSIYEFWAVATRPIANNGLGLTSVECLREVALIKSTFHFLDDKPTLYAEWETLVALLACHGKAAHDARYVANMRTHGIIALLTFNISDFARYSGITLLDPNMIAAPTPPPAGP